MFLRNCPKVCTSHQPSRTWRRRPALKQRRQQHWNLATTAWSLSWKPPLLFSCDSMAFLPSCLWKRKPRKWVQAKGRKEAVERSLSSIICYLNQCCSLLPLLLKGREEVVERSSFVAVYFLCYWRVERKWWRDLPLPLFITLTSVAVYFLCYWRVERKWWRDLPLPLFVTSTSVAVYFLCYWRVERKWWRDLPLPLFVTSISVAVYFLCYWRVERKWWRDLPLPLFVTSIRVAVYFLCNYSGHRKVYLLPLFLTSVK